METGCIISRLTNGVNKSVVTVSCSGHSPPVTVWLLVLLLLLLLLLVVVVVFVVVVVVLEHMKYCYGRFPKFHRVLLGPRPWHIEIRHRVKQTSTTNLFGFETLKLKIRRLKSWKPTVLLSQAGRSARARGLEEQAAERRGYIYIYIYIYICIYIYIYIYPGPSARQTFS